MLEGRRVLPPSQALGPPVGVAFGHAPRAVGLHAVETGLDLTAAHGAQELAGVLPEGLGADGVQERVGAGVDGVEEHQQDLGVGDSDEGHLEGGGDGEEGDGRHAEEVGEDQHGHALGDLGVGAAARELGVVHGDVDARVAHAHRQEGPHVEEEQQDDEGLSQGRLDVHGQAHAHLAVAAHAHQGQQRHAQAQEPAGGHDGGGVAQTHATLQVQGVVDGVPALQGDGAERVHRQLPAKHGQEAGHTAARAGLPLDGVLAVVATRPQVHGRDHQQVDADAEVGEGQVAHQEAWDRQLGAAREEDQQNSQVADDGQDVDEPDGHAQEAEACQVLAGVESVGLWVARQGCFSPEEV